MSGRRLILIALGAAIGAVVVAVTLRLLGVADIGSTVGGLIGGALGALVVYRRRSGASR